MAVSGKHELCLSVLGSKGLAYQIQLRLSYSALIVRKTHKKICKASKKIQLPMTDAQKSYKVADTEQLNSFVRGIVGHRALRRSNE